MGSFIKYLLWSNQQDARQPMRHSSQRREHHSPKPKKSLLLKRSRKIRSLSGKPPRISTLLASQRRSASRDSHRSSSRSSSNGGRKQVLLSTQTSRVSLKSLKTAATRTSACMSSSHGPSG